MTARAARFGPFTRPVHVRLAASTVYTRRSTLRGDEDPNVYAARGLIAVWAVTRQSIFDTVGARHGCAQVMRIGSRQMRFLADLASLPSDLGIAFPSMRETQNEFSGLRFRITRNRNFTL